MDVHGHLLPEEGTAAPQAAQSSWDHRLLSVISLYTDLQRQKSFDFFSDAT